MSGGRSVARYRLIDLSLWLVIMAVFENIVVRAAVSWFPSQPYWISVVPAVTAIVMMRWGAWGIIHAVLGGLITCLAARGNSEWYVIYAGGNALSIAAIGVKRLLGGANIREDALKSVFWAFTVFAFMQIGKALVSLIFNWKLSDTLGMIAPEIITLLFTLVVIWTARRLDGVFEDQLHYLERVRLEQERERGDKQ